MTARTRRVLGALALTSLVALTGCARGCTSSRPPIHLNPSMDDQPKVLSADGQHVLLRRLRPCASPFQERSRSAG